MSLSTILLALWVFLTATVQQLGWFTLDSKIIGWVGVAFVVVLVLEVLGVLHYNLNANVLHRHHATVD